MHGLWITELCGIAVFSLLFVLRHVFSIRLAASTPGCVPLTASRSRDHRVCRGTTCFSIRSIDEEVVEFARLVAGYANECEMRVDAIETVATLDLMLTKQEIDAYEKRLNMERAKLVAQLGEKEKPEDFGSDVEDDDSQEADEAESMANKLSVAQVYRDRLAEIDDALAAIAGGTYGVCTNCGGPISKTMLDVVPESRLCENCKKKG